MEIDQKHTIKQWLINGVTFREIQERLGWLGMRITFAEIEDISNEK